VKLLSVGLCLLSLGASFNLAAAGKVNYLNVQGDIVHFATDSPKAVASPSCAAAETSERFSLSLQSESGRGMYSLLVTAMASDLALEIESAQDCAVAPGVERALGVSVAPVSGNGDSLYQFSLYTGDGKTKLGKIMELRSAAQFYYFSEDTDNTEFQYYEKSSNTGIYFSQENCQGPAYSLKKDTVAVQKGFNDYRYFRSTDTRETIIRKSYMASSQKDVCNNISESSINVYPLELTYTDPLCGEHPCIIKKD